MKMLKKENSDIIKLIAAIFIIFGHSMSLGIYNGFNLIHLSPAWVGIFFFYSAYIIQLKKNDNYFIIKKFINIWIPYCIANSLYYLLKCYMKLIEFHISDFSMIFVGIKLSNTSLWYIIHLFIFVIVYYFIDMYFNKYKNLAYIIVYLIYLILCVKYDIGTWWYVSTSAILIGLNYQYLEKIKRLKIVVLVLTALLYGIWKIEILSNVNLIPFFTFNYSVNIVTYLFVPCFTLCILYYGVRLCESIAKCPCIRMLTSISFEMYLFHPLFILILSNIDINVVLKIILIYLCTIVFSLLFKHIYKFRFKWFSFT